MQELKTQRKIRIVYVGIIVFLSSGGIDGYHYSYITYFGLTNSDMVMVFVFLQIIGIGLIYYVWKRFSGLN